MATPKKRSSNRSVKVPDLRPAKNPKGGAETSSGTASGKRSHKAIT
jgi:hypothetical protein